MPFLRRIKLYVIGFLLGSILVYGLFHNRMPSWLPETIIKEELLQWPLQFTKHARCRMECRGISEAEITIILEEGDINFGKSKVRDKPCPSYAIEGTTEDGQFVRIVFAKCDSVTRVVTAIDLNVKHDCNCN